MHPDDAKHLSPLAIDVDQWRRDIQTFVDTTKRELQSIRDELSGDFGATKPRRSALSAAASKVEKSSEPSVLRSAAVKSPVATSAPSADDRLALLKRRLAAQISLTNSPPPSPSAGSPKLVPGQERPRP